MGARAFEKLNFCEAALSRMQNKFLMARCPELLRHATDQLDSQASESKPKGQVLTQKLLVPIRMTLRSVLPSRA